jgi:hypothetical protein
MTGRAVVFNRLALDDSRGQYGAVMAYFFISADDASTQAQEGNRSLANSTWLESLAYFVNEQQLEIVSVGYDPDGKPETLVLKGERKTLLKW